MTSPVLWGRVEFRFESAACYSNPVHEISLSGEFRSPGGRLISCPGFWDGGKLWRLRFSPDELGNWTFRTESNDAGLRGRTGSFECVPYNGDNRLLRHGPLRVSAGGRHFEHRDGTPFFWMGDTAWNGPLKAELAGWERFLEDRAAKGFTAVQFVTTQWLAAAGNADARRAYSGTDPIEIDPAFYRWLDARIDLLNDRGFVAVPVLAWAATWNRSALDQNPGTSLPDAQVVALARYTLARYGAHHAVWILAGDGHYTGDEAERWRRIGRAVFAGRDCLATMHPGGKVWVAAEFAGESWYRFNGYQSGHWRNVEACRWITNGPPSEDWKTRAMPHVNLEFCYEDHEDFDFRRKFDDLDIRRHAYWSLLAAPVAGCTYGCHGIWSWETRENVPMNHPNTGEARPWFEAMHLPGSTSMMHLKALLSSIDWFRLAPSPELVACYGGELPVGAARSEAGDLAIVYLPAGGSVEVQTSLLQPGMLCECFNPGTGERRLADRVRDRPLQVFEAGFPDSVLLFRPGP